MRRITACLLAFVLLMSLSPFASAETVSAAEKLADRLSLTSGLYTYRLLEDGTAEIIAYDARKGQEASLAVPAELDGVPVSSVGPSSFGADIYLMELTIPEELLQDLTAESLTQWILQTLPEHVLSLADFSSFAQDERVRQWCEKVRTDQTSGQVSTGETGTA